MKNSKLISGILLAVVGLLLIVLKGQVISIAATCLGVIFIVNGIMAIVKNDFTKGIITIVIGAIIILFGWLFVTIALYILGALLIAYGVLDLINKSKVKIVFDDTLKKVLYYIIPVLYIVAGACLLFNQGETVSFVFIFSGINIGIRNIHLSSSIFKIILIIRLHYFLFLDKQCLLLPALHIP